VAFPSISTGIYGYPFEEAARVAVATVQEFVRKPTGIREILFCCFSEGDRNLYETLLGGVQRAKPRG
jgi:O-acetyl-ADP-ribose deacetylase (regulator of RNase III)